MTETAQRIENKTIAKLDRKEIAVLGLLNEGICTYKGNLKSKVKASDGKFVKAESINEYQINFTFEKVTWEVIRILSLGNEKEFAVRCKLNETNEYTWYNVLTAIDFFK